MAAPLRDFYSRVAVASLIKESTINTPLTPTSFFEINDENITAMYDREPSMPVAGNRALHIRPVSKAIPAPAGTIKMNIEPKQLGHFLNGLFGGITGGNYMQFKRRLLAGTVTGTPQAGATLLQATSLATGTVGTLVSGNAYFDLVAISGAFNATNLVTGTNPDATTFTFTPTQILNSTAFVVGDTVTGAGSSKTAVVAAVNEGSGILIVTAASGNFTANEKITGTGGAIATLIFCNTTVYGYYGKLPAEITTGATYTLQFNYADSAIRYMGVRFVALDSLAQSNNIMVAGFKVMTQGAFRHARVTASTTSGATKTITVDQTYGLVAGDTIKLYRPGTGFMDFSGSAVKTNTIVAVPTATTFTVANLQVPTAVGDYVELAPQTPTYTVGNNFAWVGGSNAYVGDTVATMSSYPIEDFTLVIENAFEDRHTAQGTTIADRFPATLIQKGLTSKGTFKTWYQNEELVAKTRTNTPQALQITTQGDQIGTTGVYNTLQITYPAIQFAPLQTNIAPDAIIENAVTFDGYYSSSGFEVYCLYITDVSSF